MYYLTKEDYLAHHGVKGQRKGIKNGPPYPIKRDSNGNPISRMSFKKKNKIVLDAIAKGEVSAKMNAEKQLRHIKENAIKEGKSYIDANLDECEELIKKLYGTGTPIMKSDGTWAKRERVLNDKPIGIYPDKKDIKTNKMMIVYSNTGSHIYARKPYRKKGEKRK